MIVDDWGTPHVLYTRYLDVVTGQDLIDHALHCSGDARFDEIQYVVGDWSMVKKTEITTQDVQELVGCITAISRICPDAYNASVVKRNETGLGLAAWYRHLGESISWTIDIFHCPEEAFKHYNLDYTKISPLSSRRTKSTTP